MFCAVYAQVFFLVSFFENRKKILVRKGAIKLSKYPSVTVAVPCWNEERTIFKTVQSLLRLNYPKEKIKILLINDGSTDGTWNIIKKFSKYSNVQVFQKENGGKHTALNLGLKYTDSEFFACLDADSFVHPEALSRIMSYFEKDSSAMAVTPSIVVNEPKGVVQNAQRIEYHISVFIKKMLSFLGAIHVTPGPFTVFRREVFNKIGGYTRAHNTEDMEIAYRMQKYRMKIDNCNDAFVYTNTPSTVSALYRQRLRWIYGFINNTIDYKDLLLRRKYGNFAFFTVPAGVLSIFTVSFIVGRLLFGFVDFVTEKITIFKDVGMEFLPSAPKLDLFFLNTEPYIFIAIFIYVAMILSVLVGRKMIEDKWRLSWSTVYFVLVFSVVAPLWMFAAIFNTIVAQKPSWR